MSKRQDLFPSSLRNNAALPLSRAPRRLEEQLPWHLHPLKRLQLSISLCRRQHQNPHLPATFRCCRHCRFTAICRNRSKNSHLCQCLLLSCQHPLHRSPPLPVTTLLQPLLLLLLARLLRLRQMERCRCPFCVLSRVRLSLRCFHSNRVLKPCSSTGGKWERKTVRGVRKNLVKHSARLARLLSEPGADADAAGHVLHMPDDLRDARNVSSTLFQAISHDTVAGFDEVLLMFCLFFNFFPFTCNLTQRFISSTLLWKTRMFLCWFSLSSLCVLKP